MSGRGENFWPTLPLGRGVQLVTHDVSGLAALAKPAGVLSHPNTPADVPRSLLQARYDPQAEAYEWTGDDRVPRRLHLLNRLDSATSGVILASADGELAREIRALFKRKQVQKIYVALVFGHPSGAHQLWRDRLAVEKRGARIRTETGGNVPAECRMTVARAGRREAGVTLLRLEPHTGRSHQLRVQCARRRLPIVGDQTYGDFPRNREFARRAGTKRLFLHSLETAFDYEFQGRKRHFAAQAPLPPEFEAWL